PPKFASILPVESNLKIGARLESAQNVACSQRSKAHILLPSLRSTETPNVPPHLRPAGSFAQPSSSRYGFGAALGSGLTCANDGSAQNAIAAMTAPASRPLTCFTCRMTFLP